MSNVETVVTTETFNDFYDSIKPFIESSEITNYKKLELLTNIDVIEFLLGKKFQGNKLLLDALHEVLVTRKTLLNLI